MSSLVIVACCQVVFGDGPITRPEESYRMWCVILCELRNHKNEASFACFGLLRRWGGGGNRLSLLTVMFRQVSSSRAPMLVP